MTVQYKREREAKTWKHENRGETSAWSRTWKDGRRNEEGYYKRRESKVGRKKLMKRKLREAPWGRLSVSWIFEMIISCPPSYSKWRRTRILWTFTVMASLSLFCPLLPCCLRPYFPDCIKSLPPAIHLCDNFKTGNSLSLSLPPENSGPEFHDYFFLLLFLFSRFNLKPDLLQHSCNQDPHLHPRK